MHWDCLLWLGRSALAHSCELHCIIYIIFRNQLSGSVFWLQVGTAAGKKGEDWEYEENPADDDQDMGEGDGDEGGASPSVAARWVTAAGRAAVSTFLY